MPEKKDICALTIRLPSDLHLLLRCKAAIHDRLMNEIITEALEGMRTEYQEEIREHFRELQESGDERGE